MGGISFGPFMFSAGHFAILVAMALFMALTSVMGRLVDRRLTAWSSWAVGVFLIGGRLAHVAEHANNFLVEPWRAFEFWDGGFNWYAGLALICLSSFWLLRRSSLLTWAAVSIGVSASIAAAAAMMLAGSPGSAFAQGAFHTLDGKATSLESFAGKPIVLNLWATWCPSCREELPMMAAMAKAHPEVTFVFANQGETSDAVSQFLDQHDILLDNVILDSDLALATLLDAPGLPSTYSVGANGQVVDAIIGQISKEALTDAVQSLAGH